MEYIENQSYLDYIQHNAREIRDYVQQPFPWRYRHDGQVKPIIATAEQRFPEFARISADIPDQLDRETVSDIFRGQDLYLAFVTMLLWGGAHNGPYNSFLQTLAVGREDLVQKITRVSQLLDNGRLDDAFNSMLRNERNHIDGVSVPYFTKLIYFLRYRSQDDPRPLIYDSVSSYIHCAILIDQHLVEDYFSWNSERKLLCPLRSEYEMYEDYINRMNDLSKENAVDRSDRLEAALFGWRATRSFDRNNPRSVVKKYVKDYFVSQADAQ